MLSTNPIQQSNIFIPEYWSSTNTGRITIPYMDENFLQFPEGQGTETIPNLIISSTANLGTVASTSSTSDTITANFVGNLISQTTPLLQTDVNIPPKLALIKQTINFPVNSVTTITPSKINANLPPNAYTKYSQIFTYGKSIPPVIVSTGEGTNTLAYSTDNGRTWTGLGTSIFSVAGYCVSWNGSIWIAGGDNGNTNSIAYSYDGITWTLLTGLPLTVTYGLVWNGTLWVAVGSPSTHSIAYSYDGITWVGAYTGFSVGGRSVAWNGNLFVAVGQGTVNTMSYSIDGITWTSLGLIFSGGAFDAGLCIAWDGTKFIAGGNGLLNENLKYSLTGISGWTSITNIINFSVRGISWNGVIWVAVGQSNIIEYSYTGFSWVSAGNIFDLEYGASIYWTGTVFVYGGTGDKIGYSTNGINFIPTTSPFAAGGDGAFGFFANTVRANTIKFPSNISIVFGAGATNTMAYSLDNGLTFTGLGFPVFTSAGRGGAWNGTIWAVAGSGSNTLGYSYNGINWTSIGSSIFNTSGYSVLWNGSIFLSTGQGLNVIAYSTNGISWTGLALTSIFGVAVFDAAWDGDKFIGCGSAGKMGYSYDGITWVSITNPFTSDIISIVWSGSIWVAVGSGTTKVAYSTDGFTWTAVASSPFSTQGRGVAWNGLMFVAVGQGTNTIAYSYDGITWTGTGTTVFNNSIPNGIGWNGTRWTALASLSSGANTMAYSSNGKEWTGLGTTTFSTTGWSAAWNQGIPSVSGNITLQNPVTSLDIVAPSYYNNQNNVSITIKAQP